MDDSIPVNIEQSAERVRGFRGEILKRIESIDRELLKMRQWYKELTAEKRRLGGLITMYDTQLILTRHPKYSKDSRHAAVINEVVAFLMQHEGEVIQSRHLLEHARKMGVIENQAIFTAVLSQECRRKNSRITKVKWGFYTLNNNARIQNNTPSHLTEQEKK